MKTSKFGRRDILKGATATAALMAAVRASFPSGAFAQAADPRPTRSRWASSRSPMPRR